MSLFNRLFVVFQLILSSFVLSSSVTVLANVGNVAEKKAPYELTGFRSAKFGQTQSQVLQSIKDDFGIDKKNVKIQLDSQNKTTIMTIKVKSLSPFVVDGMVHYILGYKNKKLFQVNVSWDSGARTKQEISEFTLPALELLGYYGRYDLSAYTVVQGRRIENGMILLGLVRKDTPYAVLELVLENAKVTLNKKQRLNVDVVKGKTASFVIRYIQNIKSMDIFTLKKGAF